MSAAITGMGHHQLASGTGAGMSRWIRAFFIARRIERRTFEELDMTTDRELADLGLSRRDVRPLARLAGHQAAAKFLSA